MKVSYWIFALIFMIAFSSCEEENTLSESEVVAGLKEALKVGTDNSVEQTSKTDGYFGNAAIKIFFPEEAQQIKTAVEAIPFVGKPAVDELIKKLNRAAEDAATEAKPIFIDAITNITIQDGFDILFGADTAATYYLRKNTFDQLKSAFSPKIGASLDKVKANDAWSEVTTLYNTVSTDPVNTDLTDYTTTKALDGLFVIVGEEEKKIRENPAARVTDILQKVFSELDE